MEDISIERSWQNESELMLGGEPEGERKGEKIVILGVITEVETGDF